MTIQRTTTRITAALALLASAMAAQAGPITVDFTVTSNDVSNPAWERGVSLSVRVRAERMGSVQEQHGCS